LYKCNALANLDPENCYCEYSRGEGLGCTDGRKDRSFGNCEIVLKAKKALPEKLTIKKEKEEVIMSINNKFYNRNEIQRKDRNEASVKLASKINDLTKLSKPASFFNDNCEEIFSKTITVPIKVTCLESSGERRVYVNSYICNQLAQNIKPLISKPLINTISEIIKVVDKRDADLGCENLNNLVSDM
jgi:hypothetical protein